MGNLSNIKAALVIDEDYLIAMAIGDALNAAGCQDAQIFTSLPEALARVGSRTIDLATISIGTDASLLAEAMHVFQARATPFIFVTGQRKEESLPSSNALGDEAVYRY